MISIPKHIQEINSYKPGKPIQEIRRELKSDRIAKLGSNENSLGASKKALDAIHQSLKELQWYPEPACLDSRDAFAKYNQLKRENIIVGNGSEGVLSYIFKSFLEAHDEFITSDGSFIGVYVLAQVNNLNCKRIPLKADYSYDLDGILAAISDQTKMVYLANPNNPTGSSFGKAEFERFMEKLPTTILVVLDEAYYEYAVSLSDDYPVGASYKYENLISLRTFSKAYGLAGMRIGYGIAPERLISAMMKVKLPFEPSIVAQLAGVAALSDHDFLKRTIEMNKIGLDYFYKEFDRLSLNYYKSHANFVMLDFEKAERVEELNKKLLSEGVIVRPIAAFGLPHCIRISVGTMEENEQCIAALEKYL